MQKTSIGIALMMSCYFGTFASPVSVQTAQKVAENFIAKKAFGPGGSNVQLTKTYTAKGNSGQSSIYVFNVNSGTGFVIVSGDDAVTPVLGYSSSNQFPADVTNAEVAYWMDGYNEQISTVIDNHVAATAEIAKDWIKWTNNEPSQDLFKGTAVAPMLTTLWDQGDYYNALCPTGTPTGCVATAMAQIMKFWGHPTVGAGSNTYTSPAGVLTVNFATSNYDWANMPNTVVSGSSAVQKAAVAKLMYDCGVSVNMSYQSSASGAYVISSQSPIQNCSEHALKTYFSYSSDILGVPRSSYTDAVWNNMLKAEIDAGRPLLYTGYGASGGHAFVFDGYDNDIKFHINWGWGGMSNGYFVVNNLSPSALGIGGGGGNFNNGQQVLMKISPSNIFPVLQINSAITADKVNLAPQEAFTVTASVKNNGSGNFTDGLFNAAVYKASNDELVRYIQSLPGQNIAAGAVGSAVFVSPGIPDMTAGQYYVKILYKITSAGQWQVVDNGSAENKLMLNVGGTAVNNIPTADRIATYPNPVADVLNVDLSQFEGKITAAQLFNIQGQKVISQDIKGTKVTLPVSQVAQGMYLLHLQSDKGTIVKKVAVAK